MRGVVVPPGYVRADPEGEVPEVVEAPAAGVEQREQGLQ